MENVEEIYLHYYTPIIFLSCDVSAPLFQWIQWTIVKHVYYSRQSRWYNIPSQTFKRALVDTSCVLTLALLEECIMHLHCYSDTFYDVFVCIYLSGKEQFFSFLISFVFLSHIYIFNLFIYMMIDTVFFIMDQSPLSLMLVYYLQIQLLLASQFVCYFTQQLIFFCSHCCNSSFAFTAPNNRIENA